jgi:ribulose-phosphate 3-epimerase
MQIYPSLISSDLLNLEKTLVTLNSACDGYHIDIMDNHFVPNLTWGAAFVKAIRQATMLPLHIHLMVSNPAAWINRLEIHATDTIIFHYEALTSLGDCAALAQAIRTASYKVGIAINPSTPVESIIDIVHMFDIVLIMSVNPGFSGQNFIAETTKKIAPLIAIKAQERHTFAIGFDGGINITNISALSVLGVDNIAAAAAIFSQHNPVAALHNLYQLCKH